MTYELIITEKPSAAMKIAYALTDSKPIKKSNKGVPYYLLAHKKKDLIVVPAVGHLYGVAEKKERFVYPSFDIGWVPTYNLNKGSSFTKKYLDTIKFLSKDAKSFTIACDYDIEGEVIGFNCIRFICGQKDANRMKFSTLTKSELVSSYENKSNTLNWGQANAGET
ncbi:DNA topoisomerase I, partial [Candidatus Woesearchaeota archaeon]|nr:DNA topoisomerase I [Candidatus Woesearchaeota archaeon]